MGTEKPLFSIVVPVYNDERYIREALDSILAQTDPDWEAILVDDGSTDSTPCILNEYTLSDKRFRVFRKSNGGTGSAINKGIQEARGEWFCWLSSDDLFHPRKLELHRSWIRQYSKTHFFFTGFWLLQPDGKKIEFPLTRLNLENPVYHSITLFRTNYIIGIGICIKREAWLRNGEINEKLKYAQDLDMWLRIMLNTPAKYMPERTCTVRYHPGQSTSQFPLAPAFEASKILIRTVNDHLFKELFPKIELNDGNLALDLLRRTMDIVLCDPNSNLYALGYHPLLHFRLLEWVWDPTMNPSLAPKLKNTIRTRVREMIFIHNTSPFGLLWKAMKAAIDLPDSHFAYFPCEPSKIGEINFYYQRALQSDVEQPLRAYLERFDDSRLEEVPIQQCAGGQLFLLFPPGTNLNNQDQPILKVLLEVSQNFARMGFSVLMIGESQYTFGLVDGLPYLGTTKEFDQERLLASLGALQTLDTLVVFTSSPWLKKIKAKRFVPFEIPEEGISSMEITTAILKKIQSTPKQKRLVFSPVRFWFIAQFRVRRKVRSWQEKIMNNVKHNR